MKSIVISLPRITERRQLITEGFTGLGIEFEFLNAFDARNNEHVPISRYDEAACLANFGLPLTAPEIACYASHYSAWKLCAARGQPVAIYEDDVLLSPAFPNVLALAERLIDKHHFIRLFGKHARKFRLVEQTTPTHALVRYLQGPIGAQCYCLSPPGAAALLAKADRWTEPLDQYIDRFWIHGLPSKAIVPFELQEMDRQKITGAIGDRTKRRQGMAKLRREIARQKNVLARNLYNVIHWPL